MDECQSVQYEPQTATIFAQVSLAEGGDVEVGAIDSPFAAAVVLSPVAPPLTESETLPLAAKAPFAKLSNSAPTRRSAAAPTLIAMNQ